jgi:diguanylate cyclase (GGDEF)-like protein
LKPLAPPSPDESPAPPPAAERRATGGDSLAEALAACAALAPRLVALALLADPAAQRQALLQLPAALQAANVALARLATTAGAAVPSGGPGDALTGLADRARLAVANDAFALHYPDAPLTLIAADVDHLRHVNDTWSPAMGDAVLRAVADVLRAQSRPQDVLARADANLFVVALGGPVSTTRALLVAERLRAAIEGHGWDGLAGGLRVTASVGVATRAPGESLDDALARAVAALRECKRGGRNQVRSLA